jgi:chemotaxis protein methyltransferase CheR
LPLSTLADGLSASLFKVLAGLIRTHSGIALGDDKRTLVANRLRKRVLTLGFQSYEPYCKLLTTAAGAAEIDMLIDLVTTNHTFFYREPDHFQYLADVVLPGLAASGVPVRLWSAAVSSGEEAYTMAMVAAETARRVQGLNWQINGSDISRRMVAMAEKAIYPMDALQPVGSLLTKRYFERGVGKQEGMCRVQANLRERVRLQRINLLQSSYPLDGLQHVIFCRNVMIYFDAAARSLAVDNLTRQLAPGGYLFVGYSESLGSNPKGLEPMQHGVYRRI